MRKIILAITICLSFYSCKKDQPVASINYNYTDKAPVLNCENLDLELIKEAYYAFENAVLLKAQNSNRRQNKIISVQSALKNFMARAQTKYTVQVYTTEETAAIFKILKEQDIWEGNNLNYSSDFIKCIVSEISSDDVKQTFLALRDANSIESELMASSIYGNTTATRIYQDKALMTYVAFEMYYSKMFAVDFTRIEYLIKKDPPAKALGPDREVLRAKPEVGKPMKLDVKKKEEHGPNDGHNH